MLKKGKQAVADQVNSWVKGITDEELNAKKETITGSYKVGLATTGGLAGQIIRNAEKGYDDSTLDEYPSIIQKLTLKQINEAIKKYINPEKLVIVAAGSIDKDGQPLKEQ